MLTNLIGRAMAISAGELPRIGVVTGSGTLTAKIASILTWLFGFAGIIAVIYLVYGGILYITAGGDAEKATKGRTALVNAIVGIIIIALAVMIVVWVSRLVTSSSANPTI